MAQWQWVVLIVFCCASLIISLYCLFFMVPVKRFWERIRSLGGGMEGIEAHVHGVRDEIGRRLSELESSTQQQVAQSRESAQSSLDRLARESRETQRGLEKLRKDLQALQAELRQTAADSMKVAQGVESLTEQLHQLRGDFDALDVELRESVRQLVAGSFNSVESTVLSALEAIQGEIVYGASKSSERPKPFRPDQGRPRPTPPFGRSPGRRSPDNIITVQPLFEDLREDEGRPESEKQAQDDGEETETEEGPNREPKQEEGEN